MVKVADPEWPQPPHGLAWIRGRRDAQKKLPPAEPNDAEYMEGYTNYRRGK